MATALAVHRAMEISEKLKEKLRESGLSISDEPDFPMGHVAYPSGYMVIKPASVGGNAVPEYEAWFDEEGQEKLSDAPAMNIYFDSNNYHAEVSEGLGGVAPGDFNRSFENENELCNFVINYYFGESVEFQARVHS